MPARQVTDSGWDLSRTVKIRMSPQQVFRWGMLAGAGLACPVAALVGWLLRG